jgi:hypothetical protein
MALHLHQPTELQDTELAKIGRGCIRAPFTAAAREARALSPSGTTRTFHNVRLLSAFGGIADTDQRLANVRL